jgi:hypothetical protein
MVRTERLAADAQRLLEDRPGAFEISHGHEEIAEDQEPWRHA